MAIDLVVRDAIIVSPEGKTTGDLLVTDGRVVGVVEAGTGRGAQVVEASGLHLLPGAVDPHVHMMDPGLTEREDFITGTGAAAVGAVVERKVTSVDGPIVAIISGANIDLEKLVPLLR